MQQRGDAIIEHGVENTLHPKRYPGLTRAVHLFQSIYTYLFALHCWRWNDLGYHCGMQRGVDIGKVADQVKEVALVR